MPISVTKAEYKDNFRIYLEFDNGVSGIVDLKDSLDGEIFEPLKEQSLFKSFLLDTWTIGWSNGADFAPEFLYDLALKQNETSDKTISIH